MSYYKGESLLRYYPFLLLFALGMMGVVCVSDMLFFFVFWEFMTLTSYVLVIYERDEEINLRAGFLYFLLTHIGLLCMFVAAFLLYARVGSFSFKEMQNAMGMLLTQNTALLHLVLTLFFIGFATKAAALPFGAWLPEAHPVAPSSISAILSGVMIKMGVYGILRVFVWMLPSSHAWYIWGGVIAIFGIISMVIGSLAALTQDDNKKLIAFSSIGQIGYILLAVGMGMSFLRVAPPLAAVAFLAALYHLVNDAALKALWFLNAGSIIYRIGTRDLNRMGGLGTLMPITATTGLIACLSVAGIPPLSSFTSKWLIFQSSLIGGIDMPIYLVFGVAAFFMSVVTLAYALKYMNATFLGKSHGEINRSLITEVPISMKIPQIILAVICLGLGVLPIMVLKVLYPALNSLLPFGYLPRFTALFGSGLTGINLSFAGGISGMWNPLWLIIAAGFCFGLGYLVFRFSSAGGSRVRVAETWYGGRKHAAGEVRYTSLSFYVPFKQYFAFRVKGIDFEGLYPKTLHLPRMTIPQWLRAVLDIDHWLYYPFASGFVRLSQWFSRVHVGIPQVYILWIIIGVIAAIIVLFTLPAG
jgi:hydrogenase-4 component B